MTVSWLEMNPQSSLHWGGLLHGKHLATLAQWQHERDLPPGEHILEAKVHEQRVWSEKVHLRLKEELTANLSLRDQVRLRD